MDQFLLALLTIILGVGGAAAYFFAANRLLDLLCLAGSAAGERAQRNRRIAEAVRPWLFLGPALLVLAVYLVYPVVETLRLSFFGRAGEVFVGVDNYLWMVGDREFQIAVRNILLWLVVVPGLSTALGLVAAVLTDRLWWGGLAKALIFLPMAISLVGASVIWKFIYDYRGEGSTQIGLLNAVVEAFGGAPQAWIALPFWNTFFLMAILVWIQTGFAMVILSAALRGVPREIVEAAVLDGAGRVRIFFRILIPQIRGTIAVVWTTITILALKVFDIVLAMTNGQWDSAVPASLMYDWMFRGGGDFGRSAVIALAIMAAVLPVMVWNARRTRARHREAGE